MKKLFVCALAASMFTACSQDETISQQSPMQISFDGAFVNKASRAAEAADPSTTTVGEKGLKAFDVWAYMDDATGLFLGQNNGEDVTGEKGNFTYQNTAYWNAGHTYYFHALAPMNSDNVTVTHPTTGNALGLSNVKFDNEVGDIEPGTVDLLYSTYTRTIPSGKDALKDADNTGKVEFTFSHLLSKVKFSFKNTYTNENIHFEVKNIQMTAPKTGNINLNDADWKANSKWSLGTEENVTLAFGTTGDIKVGDTQESADERLTIPADETQEYTITFDILLYNGAVCANDKDEQGNYIPYKHGITLKDYAFEIGKAYDLYAELNADNIIDPDDPYYEDENSYPIVFDVLKVEEWDQATDEKMDDWLVTTGEELTLITDATTNKTLNLQGDNILNGNGNTLSMLEGTKDYYDGKQHLIFMQTTGNATIKNLTIDGNNATYTFDGDPTKEGEENYGIRGIYLTGEGTVTLDNVTIKNVTYTINDDAAAKTLKVINSNFEGWTSYNATATFVKVAFSTGAYGRLRPYSNTTLTDCTFTADYILDLTKLSDGEKVTLKNCKVGGTVISAENYNTLFTIEGYDANKIVFVTE